MEKTRRYGQLAFMASVTACLLALAFEQALTRGLPGFGAVAVYAFAAGFGLEFIASAWTGRWRHGGKRSQLQG
jgi:hypothetical protein